MLNVKNSFQIYHLFFYILKNIYLHKIKDALHKMLVRENRLQLYENCIQFLKTRIKLDQSGFAEDIFQH